MKIFAAAVLALSLFPALAAAEGPPKTLVEKDLRSKLDPEWVANVATVTLQPRGDVRLREGYLGKNDTKTTTFYGLEYDVRYDYKEGGGKVCPMSIVYYKK